MKRFGKHEISLQFRWLIWMMRDSIFYLYTWVAKYNNKSMTQWATCICHVNAMGEEIEKFSSCDGKGRKYERWEEIGRTNKK